MPWPVFDVANPQAMIQLAGYFKFVAEPGSFVLFRGHRRLHATCQPTLVRGRSPNRTVSSLTRSLRQYVDGLMEGKCICRTRVLSGPRYPWFCPERVVRHSKRNGAGLVAGTPRVAVEPLLQHYGLRTTWVDVVDNIWIALWFACHEFVAERSSSRFDYAHHLKRSMAHDSDATAFVSVISTGEVSRAEAAGAWFGKKARLLDLRVAAPSVYVRPHAQHGLLIATATWRTPASMDVGGLHVATLRINLGDALDWLGDGTMLRPFVLFPPATTDEGYRRLLEFADQPPSSLGKYVVYGPGN